MADPQRRVYTPWAYQDMITSHILDTPRCAVWATMGMGKTAPVLTALDALFLAGEDHPVLVVGPLRVARRVWSDEAKKWEHLRQIHVLPIVGSEQERRICAKLGASVHTINYENLEWLVDFWGERWPYKIVVADEATRLKNYRGAVRTNAKGTEWVQGAGGARARALARVTHKHVKRFIQLTGTPSPNGLKDLWGQMWFLDAGARLGRTYGGFRDRWFQRGFGIGNSVQPLPFAQVQIQDAVRDLCITIDAANYFDIKKPKINNIYVDLPARARRHYRDMEKEMFTRFEDNDIEAFGAAARTMKCLQFANGAAYIGEATDPGERKWVNVHDAKLEALSSCVAEAQGMPQIVAYQFRSDAARILKAFPGAADLSTPAGFAKFAAGGAVIGLAHPKSLGHGVDGLQNVTNIITFFGHDWDLELYDQIIGRIGPIRQAQSGHKRLVHINHIIARDTVDELVMARRETKRTVQDLLLEAMKRRIYER